MADPVRIFISHSHFDSDACVKLQSELQQQFPNTYVFLDASELHGGDDWFRRIQHEVIAAGVFIVALSQHSVIAPWVAEETNLALTKAIEDRSRKVIPVQIEAGVTLAQVEGLCPVLRLRQIIDLSPGAPTANFAELAQVIRNEKSGAAAGLTMNQAQEYEQARETALRLHNEVEQQDWYFAVRTGRAGLTLPGNQHDVTYLGDLAQALMMNSAATIDEGVQMAAMATAINPYRWDLWRLQGKGYAKLGELSKAQSAFDRAMGVTGGTQERNTVLDEEWSGIVPLPQWLDQPAHREEALQMTEAGLRLGVDVATWSERKLWLIEQDGPAQAETYAEALANKPETQAIALRYWRKWCDAALEQKDIRESQRWLAQASQLGALPAEWRQREARLAVIVEEQRQQREREERARIEREQIERERIEQERLEQERLERERREKEQHEKKQREASEQQWLSGMLTPLVKINALFKGEVIDGHAVIFPPMCQVPAGEFLMGSDKRKDPQANDSELPQHAINLGSYEIGLYPLTVAEYACAVRAKAVGEPRDWANQMQRLDHPVVNVSWNDMLANTKWLLLVTGQPWRMPTEAEWEKAARGPDGRIYPWGNQWDKTRANTGDGGPRGTTPVGSYPQGASPYGCLDMSGNVWEWTSSLYVSYPYNNDIDHENNNSANSRVLRGGSWNLNPEYARAAYRNDFAPVNFSGGRGGRVARARLSAGS